MQSQYNGIGNVKCLGTCIATKTLLSNATSIAFLIKNIILERNFQIVIFFKKKGLYQRYMCQPTSYQTDVLFYLLNYEASNLRFFRVEEHHRSIRETKT